ncbi:MAG: VWA domain-containing protein [Vicinamibacterales bacterium]
MSSQVPRTDSVGRRCMWRRAAVGVLVTLAAGPGVSAQQFRASTELVLVDVIATRVDGRLARDLTADDFEVYEDGRPQVIRQFEVVNLERASERNPDPPGVFSNAAEPGAVFALVLDDLLLDGRHTRDLRNWARRFVDEHTRPQDYVAVVRSQVDSGLVLTTDHEMALSVIDQASGAANFDVSRLTGSTDQAVPTPGGDVPQLPDFSELGLLDQDPALRIQAEQSLAMLQRMVEYLAPVPGRRKVVVFFSPGVAFDLEALASESTGRTLDAMRRLLAAAREGNVAIYTIDPRGLKGSTEPALGPSPVPAARDAGLDTLRDLATATGGRATVSTNDLTSAFEQITEENRFYYLIGYEPTATGGAKARRIEVRSRVAGIELLHRRAYAPTPAGLRLAAASPIAAPLPQAGLPVAMAPTMFPNPSGTASLAVPFEIGQGLADGARVDYTLVAVDERGKQSGGTKGSLKASGGVARGLARMGLRAGRYQVRLAAEVRDEAREGLAFANVEVADPGAELPACGGFMIVQGQGRQVQPNVSRRVRGDQPLMLATLLSARELPKDVPILFRVTAPGADAALVFPVERPQPFGKGRWRFEIALPAPIPPGELAIELAAGELPLANCRTELRVEQP